MGNNHDNNNKSMKQATTMNTHSWHARIEICYNDCSWKNSGEKLFICSRKKKEMYTQCHVTLELNRQVAAKNSHSNLKLLLSQGLIDSMRMFPPFLANFSRTSMLLIAIFQKKKTRRKESMGLLRGKLQGRKSLQGIPGMYRCISNGAQLIQKQSLLIIHNEIREGKEEEEEKIKAQFGANCVQNKQHLLNHMESNPRIVCMPRSERERDIEGIVLIFSQLLCLLLLRWRPRPILFAMEIQLNKPKWIHQNCVAQPTLYPGCQDTIFSLIHVHMSIITEMAYKKIWSGSGGSSSKQTDFFLKRNEPAVFHRVLCFVFTRIYTKQVCTIKLNNFFCVFWRVIL